MARCSCICKQLKVLQGAGVQLPVRSRRQVGALPAPWQLHAWPRMWPHSEAGGCLACGRAATCWPPTPILACALWQ